MHSHEHDETPLKFPEWVRPPLFQCFKRLEQEVKFLHLSMKGLGVLTHLPRLVEIGKDIDEDLELGHTGDKWASMIVSATKDADWVKDEIGNGFQILHAHSVVALWSTLDVLSDDLAVCWLSNQESAWNDPQIRKMKVHVREYESLTPHERHRLIISELSRSLSIELKTGVGKLEPLLGIFGLAPSVGKNLRRALHEISQIRNVIVHCGCRVDKKLLSECPWFPWEVGQPIWIDHPLYGWYYQAAYRYAERVLNQVLIAFGNRGCTCPGMDDVSPRPKNVRWALPPKRRSKRRSDTAREK
jgi:hypothetical protein